MDERFRFNRLLEKYGFELGLLWQEKCKGPFMLISSSPLRGRTKGILEDFVTKLKDDSKSTDQVPWGIE